MADENIYLIFYKKINKLHSYTTDKELLSNLDTEYLRIVEISKAKKIKKFSNIIKNAGGIYNHELINDYYDSMSAISTYELEEFTNAINEELVGLKYTVETLSKLMTAMNVEYEELNSYVDCDICDVYQDTSALLEEFIKVSREGVIKEYV